MTNVFGPEPSFDESGTTQDVGTPPTNSLRQPQQQQQQQSQVVTTDDLRDTLDHLVSKTLPTIIRAELEKAGAAPRNDQAPQLQMKTPEPPSEFLNQFEGEPSPPAKPSTTEQTGTTERPENNDTRRFTHGYVEGDLYIYVDALDRAELVNPETTRLATQYAGKIAGGKVGVADTGFVRSIEPGETPQPQMPQPAAVGGSVCRRTYRFLRLI